MEMRCLLICSQSVNVFFFFVNKKWSFWARSRLSFAIAHLSNRFLRLTKEPTSHCNSILTVNFVHQGISKRTELKENQVQTHSLPFILAWDQSLYHDGPQYSYLPISFMDQMRSHVSNTLGSPYRHKVNKPNQDVSIMRVGILFTSLHCMPVHSMHISWMNQ